MCVLRVVRAFVKAIVVVGVMIVSATIFYAECVRTLWLRTCVIVRWKLLYAGRCLIVLCGILVYVCVFYQRVHMIPSIHKGIYTCF